MIRPYLIALLFVVLYSCQNDSSISDSNEIESTTTINKGIPDSLTFLVDFLIKDYNYLLDDVGYENNKFIIQSDMEISANGLIEYYNEFHNNKGNGASEHRASICSRSPVSSICIRNRTNPCNRDQAYIIYVVIPSQVPNLWTQATLNAMNQWNELSNNKITFVRGTSQCRNGQGFTGISLTLFTDEPNIIARASLAEGGGPGRSLRINQLSSMYNSTNLAALTRVITHELGHNIGYWHTNENFGCFITGTSSNDPSSVMHSSLNLSYSGFSNFDISAHNILYPNAVEPYDEIVFKSNNLQCTPY